MITLRNKKTAIIQFSPIRSGSTLVFNILREIFPKRKITKTHQLNKKEEQSATLVSTYRNPVDCIASNLLFLQKPATEDNIAEQIHLLKTYGLVQLCRMVDRENMVLLKYEDFYRDHSLIFSQLQAFFKIELTDQRQEEISEKYQVNRVKEQYTSQFSNAFEFDKTNHWHGNHISNFKGRPNAATEVLTNDQIQMIKGALKEHMNLLGYDPN